MHFRTSSTFALALAGALTLGAAAEARGQVIPRGGKEPAPCVCDTVRIRVVDTVTVYRRDTLRVTQYDTVRMEPPVIPVPVRYFGRGLYAGLGGGATVPMQDFRNQETGWNVTGMIGYDPVTSPLGWRLDASYDQFAERANTAGASADPTLFTVNGDLKLRLPLGDPMRRFAIYGLGGLTYTRYKDMLVGPRTNANLQTTAAAQAAGLDVSSINNWTDKWGWNAGGGLSFGLGSAVDLFVESRFIAVTPDTDQSYVPIVAGLTFGRSRLP